MEDEHIIKQGGRFAAVFDGHGGSAVSHYLKQNLYAHYLQSISQISSGTKSSRRRKTNVPETNPPTLKKIIQAFRSAFREIDSQVQQVSHWSYQGSTAVAVYLHEHWLEETYESLDERGKDKDTSFEYDSDYIDTETKKMHRQPPKIKKRNTKKTSISIPSNLSKNYQRAFTLVSFNVGDSRAILCRDGIAIPLTSDHKPNTPSEKQRIESLGGRVTWCGPVDPHTNLPISDRGVYRMNGNLAVSRAIGDRSERPCASASVDVKVIDIMRANGDDFIVLGSDGLWDVMKNQDVVDFIQERILQEEEKIEEEINEIEENNSWEMSDGKFSLSILTVSLSSFFSF